MNQFMRDIRLIPIVLIAAVCLLTLKITGLIFDGGYTLAERLQGRDKASLQVTTAESVPEYPKIVFADKRVPADTGKPKSWAQEMFNFPDSGGSREVTGSVAPREIPAKEIVAKEQEDITGSAGGDEKKPDTGPPLKTSTKPPDPPKLEVAGASIPIEHGRVNSPGERAILERLQDRRQELDSRNRELEMRESLLKAAEKRLDAKVNELKDVETRVNTATETREKVDAGRFKTIVSMYENMKPKEAARIFDRLDIKILVGVSTAMNPRTMSAILAQMAPEAAERLTVELAGRAGSQTSQSADQLPKIEGRPGGG
jgi:flagellar motility protein MotE (MotC chaperone)